MMKRMTTSCFIVLALISLGRLPASSARGATGQERPLPDDIPGLIEGAADGKGLGVKFLRHIERTGTLFHFISAESPDPVKDYQVVRRELGRYKKELLDKPEYIFLSKADVLAAGELTKKVKGLKKLKKEVIPISIIDEESIKKTEAILRTLIAAKKDVAVSGD